MKLLDTDTCIGLLKGTPLADADIIIASIAIEEGLTLVTGNVRHYGRIEGLVIENWFARQG